MANPWDEFPDAPETQAAPQPWDEFPDAEAPATAEVPAAAEPRDPNPFRQGFTYEPQGLYAKLTGQANPNAAPGEPGSPWQRPGPPLDWRETARAAVTGIVPAVAARYLPGSDIITKMAVQAVLSGLTSRTAGELIAPSPNAEAANDRALTDAVFGAGGELLGVAPKAVQRTVQGGLLAGGGAALATGDPEAGLMAMLPGAAIGLAANKIPLLPAARSLTRRGLGYTKAGIDRASGLDIADRAAQIALEEDVPRVFQTNKALLKRAGEVGDRAGQTLGDIRAQADATGQGVPVGPIIADVRGKLKAPVPGRSDEPLIAAQRGEAISDIKSQARVAPVTVQSKSSYQPWAQQPTQYQSDLFDVLNQSGAIPPGALYATPKNAQQKAAALRALWPSFAKQAEASHARSVREAIVNGQQVPEQVLKHYPGYAEKYFPKDIKVSGVADAKKYYGSGRAYDEKTGKLVSAMDEQVRGSLEDAENAGIAKLVPSRSDEFQRGKDVYGAMKKLTDPKHGVTEGLVRRLEGNNLVMSMGPALGTGMLDMAAGQGGALGTLLQFLAAQTAYRQGAKATGKVLWNLDRAGASPLAQAIASNPFAVGVGRGLNIPSEEEQQGLGLPPQLSMEDQRLLEELGIRP